MMKRMQTLGAIGAALLMGSAQVGAGENYTLASAQVVTSTTHAPSLRLHASGPIAFRVVPPAELRMLESPGMVVARLYGVYPSVTMAAESLAPFTIQVVATDDGTLLTVTTAVSPGARLELRMGDAANELEVRQVQVEQ